ncbi:MAG: autotransporter domain-containing protein [Alphaproteobacteria bacterium]|nr:autotransporter domain-containing protein [Alphaproteobacteria bacterium]
MSMIAARPDVARARVAATIRGLLVAIGLAWPALAAAQQPPFIQSFQSQGPAPNFGPANEVQSGDALPNGTTSGAIQAVLPNPTNASQLFIGSTNGGVWSTNNGGATWKPLTDNQASLSIASLAFNATNSQQIYAGVGITSNGIVGNSDPADRGGARNGILWSNDGGTTWQPLAGTAALQGKSVVSVAASGNAILAATAEYNDTSATNGYGLYRSVNGGAFQVAPGLPQNQAATSLAGQGTQANPYYVAIAGNGNGLAGGIYRSVSNDGTGFALLQGAGTPVVGANQAARVATGPNGSVAVAVYNTANGGKLATLYVSPDGVNWTAVPGNRVPVNVGSSQANVNLAVAVDRSNPNVVYVSGDAINNAPFTVSAYRVTLQAGSPPDIQPIVNAGAANGSTAHADSRSLAFDASGNLILLSDGGIYVRSNPTSAAGGWSGLNTSGLSLREAYGVAYDAVSKRLLVAAQDNGTSFQTVSGGSQSRPIEGGDGVFAAINDITNRGQGQSFLYTSFQNFGDLKRTTVDAQGNTVGAPIERFNGQPTATTPIINFAANDFSAAASKLPMGSLFLLNRNDPTRIALGTNYVYVTRDDLLFDPTNPAPLTNVGQAVGQIGSNSGITALAYGTTRSPNVLLAGSNSNDGTGQLYISTTALAGSLRQLAAYSAAPVNGGAPTSLVLDPRSAFDNTNTGRFFVADGVNLWGSNNSGIGFTNLTANLTNPSIGLNVGRPNAVEFISNNGVNALLVGGINGLYKDAPNNFSSLSPIAVANCCDSGTGMPTGWAPFGRFLPNTIVNRLAYNPAVDVLAISLFGRGIWALYDVTSYFATATTLKYGQANNDSAPDASFLTNGVYASRSLEKSGTGTLTINGTSSYTGPTTISGGQLNVVGAGSIASSTGVVNNAVFDVSGAASSVGIQALSGSGQVNLGGQNLAIGNANGLFSGTIADGGAFGGAGGSLTIAGGTQTLGGVNTYTGGTTVVPGATLNLTGSILGSLFLGGTMTSTGGYSVAPGATFSNTGTFQSLGGATLVSQGTLINNGQLLGNLFSSGFLGGSGSITGNVTNAGTIAPGNSIGTLTINGSYTQTAGSTFQTQVNSAGQASRIAVNGSAVIQGGTLAVTGQPGVSAPRTTYTLLTTTGGLSGAYSSYVATLGSPFLQPSFTYDANNVYLNLTINGFLAAAQTPLQAAVGWALDGSVYSANGDYATVLTTLANLSPSQIPAILTSLSGTNYSGFSNSMVQGAQLFMNNFLSQASGANRGSNKVALAEACDVACDTTEPAKWGVWGGGLGGLGTVGAGQPVGGVTYNLDGIAAGIDRLVGDGTRVGVTVGYSGGSQWVSGFSGQGFTDTVLAGLYGGFAQDALYLDGVVGYAYSAERLSRSIVIPGLAARTATGQTGANQVYGQLEGGYRFDIGTAADAFVTPFARLQGFTGTQNGFTEGGAQSLSLNVAAQTTTSLRTVLGAQLGGGMNLGWRDKLNAQLRLGWAHEYADTSRPVVASFVGAPASPFTTYGVSPQRDSAVVGLAANTAIADTTSLYLRYEGNISNQDSSHALTAGVRMTW